MTLNQIRRQELAETRRANLAKEAENSRSNVARENETTRHNQETESIDRSRTQSQNVRDTFQNVKDTFSIVTNTLESPVKGFQMFTSGVKNLASALFS